MSSGDRDDPLFTALADGRRREILDLLKEAPRTTGDPCRISRRRRAGTAVRRMQHLGVLERADLVIARREGRHRWNHLNAAPFREIYDRWISAYAAPAVELLARLKRDLEPGA